MIVEIIPCLSDNYSYLIHEKETDTVSIVDPSEFNTCDKVINKYKKSCARPPISLVLLAFLTIVPIVPHCTKHLWYKFEHITVGIQHFF